VPFVESAFLKIVIIFYHSVIRIGSQFLTSFLIVSADTELFISQLLIYFLNSFIDTVFFYLL
jgi:hypothetical protein